MRAAIKEFFVYKLFDAQFLIRVQTLYSAPVDPEEYALLAALCGQSGADVTAREREVLEKFRLIDSAPEPPEARSMGERRRRARIAAMAHPFFAVELMVSQRCNMRCTYCLGGAEEYRHGGMMDEATALRAIDRMHEVYEASGRTTRPYLMFLGGEPLLNEALIRRCIAYCKERFGPGTVGYSLSTNGVLAEPVLMEFLRSSGVDVSYSFDGPYQNENRLLPGGGDSHAMITARIRAAVARGGRARCLGVYYPHQDPAAMAASYQEIEGLHYKTNAVVGSPVTDSRAGGCRLEYTQKAAALPLRAKSAVAAVKAHDGGALLELLRDDDFARWLLPALFSPAYPRQSVHCDAERGRVCVDAGGALYPCHSFIGVAKSALGTLDTGLQSGAFTESLSVPRPACADCALRYGCAGGCRAAFSMLPEAADAPDPLLYVPAEFCAYQKQKLACHPYVYWSLTEADRAWARALVRTASD